MTFKKKTFCAVMLIGMLGITPPSHAEASRDKTSMDEIRQEAQDQRDEAIHETKEALDNLDKRIDALESDVDKNWDKMNQAARENARESLKVLRKQRIQVAEWFGSLKNSVGDAWNHMEKGFSDAYTSLNKAWEKFEKEFGSDR